MQYAMKEKPGVQLPWASINQLLASNEKFEVQIHNKTGFVLSPKHSSQLAALLYLLNQQGIEFGLQGIAGDLSQKADGFVLVSNRAFTHLCLHEQGIVEAGAGCSLFDLHQFLFENNQEAVLKEDPLSSSKQSISEIILSGKTAGLRLHREALLETFLGVEFVTVEGKQVQWGGPLRTALAGPSLHKLLVGLESFPGLIVKVYLKTFPLPQVRLRLAWTFAKHQDLQEHYHNLSRFSEGWEYLEFVRSGCSSDRGFVFAQVSGSQKEMELLSIECPYFASASLQGEREQLKKYLQQQTLKTYAVSCDHLLDEGEYLWYQNSNQKAWWVTSKTVENLEAPEPVWKKRFLKSLGE